MSKPTILPDGSKCYTGPSCTKHNIWHTQQSGSRTPPINLLKLSKTLSYLLRHHPETANLTLNSHGFVNVETLIKQINTHFNYPRPVTITDIATIIREDNKKRYEIQGNQVRATQGHSIKTIQNDHKETTPPEFLYHGTTTTTVPLILKEGLKPMSRNLVHLSENITTATQVGTRRGNPQILTINAQQAHQNGIKFYLTKNNVWLVKYLPPEYITVQ